jgi:hypothetical protein
VTAGGVVGDVDGELPCVAGVLGVDVVVVAAVVLGVRVAVVLGEGVAVGLGGGVAVGLGGGVGVAGRVDAGGRDGVGDGEGGPAVVVDGAGSALAPAGANSINVIGRATTPSIAARACDPRGTEPKVGP